MSLGILSTSVGDMLTPTCKASGGMQKQTDPIPIGRYWIDIIGLDNIQVLMPAMNQAAAGGVIVIEDTKTTTPTAADKLTGGLTEPVASVLFRVTGYGSISIDPTRYGYPTIANPCVKQIDDTDSSASVQAALDADAKKKQLYIIGAVGLVVLVVIAHTASEAANVVRAAEGH